MNNLVRSVSALALAGFVASALTILLSFGETVDASAPLPSGRPAVSVRPLAAKCAEQSWPYLDAECVRDNRKAQGAAISASRTVAPDRAKLR